MINLTRVINISRRGTTDNALTLHVRGLGFDSPRWRLFFFLKPHFHFWTDLQYNGRLIIIAGSLSAFIPKILYST